MTNIIAIIIAYLLGSLSCAIILTKILNKADPRDGGSGNAGATNILRTVGKNEAVAVLVGDILKGLFAIWIARILGVHGFMLGIVGVAAVIGHVFPVFFKFKGGKGVATAGGAVLGLSFWAGIIMLIAWVAVALITRFASLASLVAIGTSVITVIIFGKGIYFIPVLIMAAIIVYKHQDNIKRLRSGTENKIVFKNNPVE